MDTRLGDSLVFFLGYLAAYAAWQVLRSRRTRVFYARLTRADLRRGLGCAGVVLALALALSAVPGLDWRLLDVGEGSLLLSSPGAVAGRSASNPWVPWVAGCLPVLLLVAMPRLVWAEEVFFRRRIDRRHPVRQALTPLVFGLSHLVMGIPLYAALAIAVAGGLFQRAYLAGWRAQGSRLQALRASANAHYVYNMALLCAFTAGALGLVAVRAT